MKEVIAVVGVIPMTGEKSGKPFHRVNDKFNIFEAEDVAFFTSNLGKNVEIEMKASKCGQYQNLAGRWPTDKPVIDSIVVKPEVQSGTLIEKGFQRQEIIELIKEQLVAPKQNSRSWGKGEDSVKIYFKDADDLEAQIDSLMALNLIPKAYYVAQKEKKEYFEAKPVEETIKAGYKEVLESK